MTVRGSWVRAASGAGLLGANGEIQSTIFAEMSAIAAASGAINLGQGFPDEDGPQQVLDEAVAAIRAGVNQYPPGRGFPVLRTAIAEHQRRFYGINIDPETEILVTAGATEALAATLLALVEPDDEVITFEPFYDAYGALIELAGGVHKRVALRLPDFQPDLSELEAAFSNRTRAILINTPHNPTGTVFPVATLQRIVELAEKYNATIITDEVYEHLTFGVPHIPISTLESARERTVTISSGGKTFNTTGWKIGWLSAPAAIVTAILTVKQYLTFVNGAPFQSAIAAGLALPDEFFAGAADTLRNKRDLLSAGLIDAGFSITPPAAGYFVVADARPLGYEDARELCLRLPELAGVVGIPITAFVRADRATDYSSLIRFAYCKKEAVLSTASAQLAALAR